MIDTEARAMLAALQARIDALEARAHTHPGPHDEPPGVLVCACGHVIELHMEAIVSGERSLVCLDDDCVCRKWRPVRREIAD